MAIVSYPGAIGRPIVMCGHHLAELKIALGERFEKLTLRLIGEKT